MRIKRHRVAEFVLLWLLVLVPSLCAQQQTTEQKLQRLERQISEINRRLGMPETPATQQQTTEERLQRLEQQLSDINRRLGTAPVTATAANVNLKYGQPACHGTLLVKPNYIICHLNTEKIPEWVTYRLTAADLQGTAERTDDFRPDPELPEGQRAELADYKYSGYQRGHNAPAADFTRSRTAMSNSFLLSNMAPQTPNLNQRTWEKLEEQVRSLVQAHGEIYIFTGSLFLDANGKPVQASKFIGKDKVAVPTHFYKVILCEHQDGSREMFAFVMKNQRAVLKGTPKDYIVSVRDVERMSGLDFFAALPDDVENHLETLKATNWPIQIH